MSKTVKFNIKQECLVCGKQRTPADNKDFHPVPTEENLLKKWLSALYLNTAALPPNATVCSDHFLPQDFYIPELKMSLKKNAVPIANLREDSSQSIGNFTKFEVKCRTCFESKYSTLNHRITDFCYKNITVEDALLKLMPDLKPSIDQTDLVCEECFRILNDVMKFVEKFTEVETSLANVKVDDVVETDVEEVSDILDIDFVQDEVEGDQFEIKMVEDDNNKEEERFFEEVGTLCNAMIKHNRRTAALYKPEHIKFSEELISVSIPNKSSLNNFLYKCRRNVSIFKHQSAFNCEYYRVLLLGEQTVKTCKCGIQSNTVHQYQRHINEKKCVNNSNKLYYRAPNMASIHCDVCHLKKGSISYKQKHMKQCPLYECSYCKEKISVKLLPEHSKKFHNELFPFKCDCKKEFKTHLEYRGHACMKCKICGQRRKHKECVIPTRKCRYCFQPISLRSYKMHVLTEHKKFKCRCQQSFLSEADLEQHKQRCSYHQKVLCPHCGKLLVKLSLRQHLKTHEETTREKLRDKQCQICGKTFYASSNLSRHIKLVHNSNFVNCHICNITLKSTALVNHIRLKHDPYFLGNKTYECEICNKVLSRKEYLQRHMRTHTMRSRAGGKAAGRTGSSTVLKCGNAVFKKKHVNPNQPIICKFCLKNFKDVGELKRHLPSHSSLVRYKCKFCSMTFSNANNRARHQRQFHKDGQDTNKIRCDTCWRYFSNEENLQMHVNTVHTIKKYICSECGEAFSRHFQLNTHFINTHVEENDVESEQMYLYRKGLEDYVEFDENEPEITHAIADNAVSNENTEDEEMIEYAEINEDGEIVLQDVVYEETEDGEDIYYYAT